ncbi:4Fe-4S binding protein [Sunxiuqinia sp. A32]|uniref:4Fe-4S binding protein n=1 Tax=Sunxiuqinia sp. A32 TaxID=3461496 RepID=UPI0040467CA2
MKQIKIVEHLCPQNHFCPVVSVCHTGAIIQRSPFEAPAIDERKCTNCGRCTRFCAYGAFQIG